MAEGGVGGLQLLEGADERLGDEAPAEVALDAPVAAGVGLEQARDGRGSGPEGAFGRSKRAARARLAKRATASGSLRGRSPGDARRLHARGDVDADRGDGEERAGDGRRVEPAGQDHRDLPGDRGREVVSARVPVPPGCGPPAVSRTIRAAPAARWARARATASSTSRARSAASSGACAGRWTTAQAGRGEAAIRAGGSPPANWIASTFTSAASAASSASSAPAVIATSVGVRVAAGGAGAAGQGRALGDGQRAGRARPRS